VARALIFFCVNLTTGLHAAVAALLTELAFRGVASGFYGAITEAFRFAKPEWAASLVAMILLPLTGHSLELAVHFLRATAKLRTSVLASICFTAVSTLFNLYAMRRGALVTGQGQESLGSDIKRMPSFWLERAQAKPTEPVAAIPRLTGRTAAVMPCSLTDINKAATAGTLICFLGSSNRLRRVDPTEAAGAFQAHSIARFVDFMKYVALISLA
jgi:hypothetical protein